VSKANPHAQAVGQIQPPWPTAPVLAAGADRDVSEVRAELRAHTQGLNALRETELEQGREITSLRQEMREGLVTRDSSLSSQSMSATGRSQRGVGIWTW
jgi:hypothetical protein